MNNKPSLKPVIIKGDDNKAEPWEEEFALEYQCAETDPSKSLYKEHLQEFKDFIHKEKAKSKEEGRREGSIEMIRIFKKYIEALEALEEK